jgi:PBP1b-binding outer membrane lipoprotein LpoB
MFLQRFVKKHSYADDYAAKLFVFSVIIRTFVPEKTNSRRKMKKYSYIIALLLTVVMLAGCEKYETYSDMKKKEQDAIQRFIQEQGIEVIDQTTFESQGNKTDLAKNQFVKFTRNGVYMQIVREGCGSVLEEEKTVNVLCRFMEQNIKTGDVMVRNDVHASMSSIGSNIDVSQFLDKMSVQRLGTTITASFISGMMYRYHGSASVPGGWLVPLNYVKIGRPENDGEETAKVRLIVPHSQGTADASSSVTPCYYEVTYQRER